MNTAPELTPLFSTALASQVAPILAATARREIVEIGGGSGRLAADLLNALAARDALPSRYSILEVSPDLSERQRATLAHTPSAWMAHNNLGLVLEESKRLDEAAEHFREAIRLRPAYAEALYNLGNVLAAQGRLAEAAEQYGRALALDDRFAVVHNNLGNVLVMLGRVAEGRRHYVRALELDPGYTAARENLAATE